MPTQALLPTKIFITIKGKKTSSDKENRSVLKETLKQILRGKEQDVSMKMQERIKSNKKGRNVGTSKLILTVRNNNNFRVSLQQKQTQTRFLFQSVCFNNKWWEEKNGVKGYLGNGRSTNLYQTVSQDCMLKSLE